MTATTIDLATIDLDELDEDGATVELEDGRRLRVRVVADEDASVNDYDCYGRIAWVEKDRDYGRDKPRPEGFDGRAHKLSTYHGERFWWQPPWDMGMPADDLARSRGQIVELVEYGFHGIILELLDGEDAYHRPIVVDVASLWGIDDVGSEYVREIVGELVGELGGLS